MYFVGLQSPLLIIFCQIRSCNCFRKSGQQRGNRCSISLCRQCELSLTLYMLLCLIAFTICHRSWYGLRECSVWFIFMSQSVLVNKYVGLHHILASKVLWWWMCFLLFWTFSIFPSSDILLWHNVLTTIAGHASNYKFSGFVLQQLKVYVIIYLEGKNVSNVCYWKKKWSWKNKIYNTKETLSDKGDDEL